MMIGSFDADDVAHHVAEKRRHFEGKDQKLVSLF